MTYSVAGLHGFRGATTCSGQSSRNSAFDSPSFQAPMLLTVAMVRSDISARFAGLESIIGNTPFLAIDYEVHGRRRTIFAKSEQMNFTGSIRSGWRCTSFASLRPRWYPVGRHHCRGDQRQHRHFFRGAGPGLGHAVTIFMPNWMSRERMDLIHSLGANIIPVTKAQGGFLGSIHMAEELAAQRDDVFLPRQFSNTANVEAHEHTTGPELYWQLKYEGLAADAFVAGVGTGGTVMGVGRFLKRMDLSTRVYPMEPAESPTLSTGCKLGNIVFKASLTSSCRAFSTWNN